MGLLQKHLKFGFPVRPNGERQGVFHAEICFEVMRKLRVPVAFYTTSFAEPLPPQGSQCRAKVIPASDSPHLSRRTRSSTRLCKKSLTEHTEPTEEKYN